MSLSSALSSGRAKGLHFSGTSVIHLQMDLQMPPGKGSKVDLGVEAGAPLNSWAAP